MSEPQTPMPPESRVALETLRWQVDCLSRLLAETIDLDGRQPLMRASFATACVGDDLKRLARDAHEAWKGIDAIRSANFDAELKNLVEYQKEEAKAREGGGR